MLEFFHSFLALKFVEKLQDTDGKTLIIKPSSS